MNIFPSFYFIHDSHYLPPVCHFDAAIMKQCFSLHADEYPVIVSYDFANGIDIVDGEAYFWKSCLTWQIIG